MHSQGHFRPGKAEELQEVCEQHLGFHHRHVLTNATSRSRRKRNICVALPRQRFCVRPTLRVEALRLLVVLGIVHESQQVRPDETALAQMIRTKLHVTCGLARENANGWWPHPKTLLQELLCIVEFLSRSLSTLMLVKLMSASVLMMLFSSSSSF